MVREVGALGGQIRRSKLCGDTSNGESHGDLSQKRIDYVPKWHAHNGMKMVNIVPQGAYRGKCSDGFNPGEGSLMRHDDECRYCECIG